MQFTNILFLLWPEHMVGWHLPNYSEINVEPYNLFCQGNVSVNESLLGEALESQRAIPPCSLAGAICVNPWMCRHREEPPADPRQTCVLVARWLNRVPVAYSHPSSYVAHFDPVLFQLCLHSNHLFMTISIKDGPISVPRNAKEVNFLISNPH